MLDRTNRRYIVGALVAFGIFGLVLIGRPAFVKTLAGKVREVRGGIEKIGVGIRGRVWGVKIGTEGQRDPEGEQVPFGAGAETEEIEELRRKIDVLEFEVAKLKGENEALRKQLEAPLPPDLGLIPARVVGLSWFLYIDKGARDGVKKGDAVISEEIFVGQVVEVGELTSKIRLLSDPESKIPVRTMQGALGLLVGEEGKKLRLEKVLQREELAEGDLVGTSGGDGLPADLLIGKVSSLLSSEKEVYKNAEVEPGIEYGGLLYVFVVQ